MRPLSLLLLCGKLTAWLAAFGVAASAAPKWAVSSEEIRSFMGGAGVLAFQDLETDRLVWADLSLSDPDFHVLPGSAGGFNPRLSPDGVRLAYVRDGNVFAARLEDGETKAIGHVGEARSSGTVYWWREGDKDYLIYATATDKFGYANGKTWKQEMNGILPSGDAQLLADKAYDGGISGDGRWLAETYGKSFALDLNADREYDSFYKASGAKEGQTCNGSLSPDDAGRFLKLVLPHDYIRLFRFDEGADRWQEEKTFTKPTGAHEWQHTEYTTSPDFFTTTLSEKAGGDYHLQLLKISTGERLKFVSGDIGTSHLYFGDAGLLRPSYAEGDTTGTGELQATPIRVVEPDSGIWFAQGSPLTVKWLAPELLSDGFILWLVSSDSQQVDNLTPAKMLDGTARSVTWNVPEDLVCKNCRIFIADYTDNHINGVSAPFSIGPTTTSLSSRSGRLTTWRHDYGHPEGYTRFQDREARPVDAAGRVQECASGCR